MECAKSNTPKLNCRTFVLKTSIVAGTSELTTLNFNEQVANLSNI